MVKSVLSVSHRGLSDWVIQRITAIVMALYSVFLIGYFVLNPQGSFAEWHTLFSYTITKIATILFLLCVMFHAWIGMWTIFTDYVKSFVLRFILEILVFFMLVACFIWGVMILWSV